MAWERRERPWIEAALTTWGYFFGLVELSRQNENLISFRLTQFGKEVLHPEVAPAPTGESSQAIPGEEQPAAWIVQPNFDVVVYLDHIDPAQLAFLEAHAEREKVDEHMAQYRLRRASVYRGLESGTQPEDLLERLAAASGAPLPKNIITEVREWAALREQITLRKSARLVEYPSPEALQAERSNGAPGKVIGGRFLLLEDGADARFSNGLRQIDYAQPLPKTLSVSEDGRVHLAHTTQDLMVAAQVGQWAERQPQKEWQLTEASIQAALKKGLKLTHLLTLLEERLTRPLPLMLEIALRAWAGGEQKAELETAAVLHCSSEKLFQAIISSVKLKPYLKGYRSPDLILIDKAKLEAFQAELAWAGIQPSAPLKIQPFVDTPVPQKKYRRW